MYYNPLLRHPSSSEYIKSVRNSLRSVNNPKIADLNSPTSVALTTISGTLNHRALNNGRSSSGNQGPDDEKPKKLLFSWHPRRTIYHISITFVIVLALCVAAAFVCYLTGMRCSIDDQWAPLFIGNGVVVVIETERQCYFCLLFCSLMNYIIVKWRVH